MTSLPLYEFAKMHNYLFRRIVCVYIYLFAYISEVIAATLPWPRYLLYYLEFPMGSPHVSKVTQIALEYAHNVQRTHKLRDPYMAGGPMHRDPDVFALAAHVCQMPDLA
ncbi:hypothetical protein I7I51_02328, partial [Histoplasma capsulatum]